jgi:hypothetical protein
MCLSIDEMTDIVIRQDGTRQLGCDESSGWIWHAARKLEEMIVLTMDGTRPLSILELGAGTGWLSLRLGCRIQKLKEKHQSTTVDSIESLWFYDEEHRITNK